MFFTVIDGKVPADARPKTAYLIIDQWDDWFSYRTMFTLVVLDEAGETHHPGSVKIGQVGMRGSSHVENGVQGQRSPDLPTTFDALGSEFFSLGQDENYYETLNRLSESLKAQILVGLRDVAADQRLFDSVESEDVAARSLLRSVAPTSVRGRYHRLALGDAKLTEFHFVYTLPPFADESPPRLSFDVRPEAQPPTNVHVLIGRNGVGKTRLMQGLAHSLLGHKVEDGSAGDLGFQTDALDDIRDFAGLVMVSFSAFDEFNLGLNGTELVKSIQVGLRTSAEFTKSPAQLTQDFVASLELCRVGLRATRWRKAVSTLGQDDLFAESNVSGLLDLDEDVWVEQAERIFRLLSSGHKVILLTMTKLVELVDERTLVLLDEPEAHLHPPLLAAFVRSLSDLLNARNGVAIIATHSPVVLQEIPRSCVWKIRRDGGRTRADRPEQETFAENVSDLTREVFNLEVTKTGFHKSISDIAERNGIQFEDVLAHFAGQIGAEGRALARALIAERDNL